MDNTLIQSIFSGIEYKGFQPSSIIAISIATILVMVSAFMSSSETGFFSLKPADFCKIKEEHTQADNTIEKLLGRSEHLLATVLIGNNLVNIAIVILLNFAVERIFDFRQAPVMGFILQTVILTLILLIFGEIIPKVYSQQEALKISRFSAPKFLIISKIVHPLANLLVKCSALITKIIGTKKYDITVDELSQAVHLTTEDREEKEMIRDIIKFYNKTASEIMVPRIDMVDLNYEWDFHEMLNYAINSGYSRIPVFEGTEDNIKGLMYLKDLIPHKNKPRDFGWHSLIRPVTFVPENKKIDDLLEEFRLNKIHFAIVVDEYGGTQGVITLEDILEEIVGEISDEYDEAEKTYRVLSDGSFMFDARTSLSDVCDLIGVTKDYFEEKGEEVDTLGGLVLEIKEDLAKRGDILFFKDFRFVVVSMENRRITEVKISSTISGKINISPNQ